MRVLLSLFTVGILIFLHELGHLLFARALGIRASHVTFGFGPALSTLRWRGLRFTLGAIPLGGSVELQGENPHVVDPSRAPAGYSAQPPLKRLFVLLGGPLTNFFIAPVALFFLYLGGTHVAVPSTVGMVEPGSEAARAQIRPGDRIVSVDGVPLQSWSALNRSIEHGGPHGVDLTISRSGSPLQVHVTPSADEGGQPRIGVAQQFTFQTFNAKQAVGEAFLHTGRLIGAELRLGVRLLRGGRAGFSDAGRLVRSASEAAATGGLDSALRAAAGLTLALTLLYLVPVPALDGGRLVMVAWELWRKQRIQPRVLTLYQTVGFLVLLGLLLWVAWSNVRRLLP